MRLALPVDPAVTQRNIQRLVVGDGLYGVALLAADQPDPGRRRGRGDVCFKGGGGGERLDGGQGLGGFGW